MRISAAAAVHAMRSVRSRVAHQRKVKLFRAGFGRKLLCTGERFTFAGDRYADAPLSDVGCTIVGGNLF